MESGGLEIVPGQGDQGEDEGPRRRLTETYRILRDTALARTLIALCNDIVPLLLPSSGVRVSDVLKPPALFLKASMAGVVQFH